MKNTKPKRLISVLKKWEPMEIEMMTSEQYKKIYPPRKLSKDERERLTLKLWPTDKTNNKLN